MYTYVYVYIYICVCVCADMRCLANCDEQHKAFLNFSMLDSMRLRKHSVFCGERMVLIDTRLSLQAFELLRGRGPSATSGRAHAANAWHLPVTPTIAEGF